MVQPADLSDIQTIILATQFTAESNFTQLQLLAAEHKQTLTSEVLYRLLLTYLPYDVETLSSLARFIAHLENGFKDVSQLDEVLDTSGLQDIPQKELIHKAHNLRLENAKSYSNFVFEDNLSAFVIQWLHKVEETSGVPTSAMQLLDPFVHERPGLKLWQDSYLVPLLKLQNDFYAGRAETLDLGTIERLQGVAGVKTLLRFAEQDEEKAQVGRDLDEVITPWVRGASQTKRRKLSRPDAVVSETSWQNVNEWIYGTASTNFDLAAKSFLDWDGPKGDASEQSGPISSKEDELLIPYVQTGVALITTSTGTGETNNSLLRQLLDRAGSLLASSTVAQDSATKHTLEDATKLHLLENAILQPNNPITQPTEAVFSFLEHGLTAQRILNDLKILLPLVAIVDTALFGSEERQKQELLRILQQIPRLTRSEIDWPAVRQQLHTLHSGSDVPQLTSRSAPSSHLFLGRVPLDYLESELMDILIGNGLYTTVIDIYLSTPTPPLEKDIVRDHVVSAIYAAYDNATNGNRTRGGMKRAHDILRAFQSHFASAPIFTQIDHLIRATHSLSFYQLTLQHGVPFQPATIRIHHDPLSLIEKVLAQNYKAFTKLDDLLEIGQNLVLADLPKSTSSSDPPKSWEERLFDAQHRITYLAISSALADHDFGTAYSYITTRLATSPSQASNAQFTDDTSWRAAYAAGKYRPAVAPTNLHDRITGLSKRMDLLSLALTLTPSPDSLPEILATWRRCEEEMDSLKTQAVEEERTVDIQSGITNLPGGFTEARDIDAAETRRMMERRALGGSGPSYEEEAPMGLFDVARGAASAFKKSAFPLRNPGRQINVSDRVDSNEGSGRESMDEQRQSGEYQRVRKRDMVSNMVTGGLVSGMSWVLGAAPVKQGEEKQ